MLVYRIKCLFYCLLFTWFATPALAWGFYAHKKINYYAVFLLPPEMMQLYKVHLDFLNTHAVDPDMRRYAVAQEAPRHYIDLDRYGKPGAWQIPERWDSAVLKFTEDTLAANGIVPWWIQTMLARLTKAFKDSNQYQVLKLSAEIGHYIGDAHVPLHASSNHDGQLSNQKGIHGFWESRLPELFCDQQYDFFIGKAVYIGNPGRFIWQRVRESGMAADTVLKYEAELNASFPADRKFAFEARNGKVILQYSTAYASAYQDRLQGMVERRMRQSIFAVASFWYTAWVNAGQPDLRSLRSRELSAEELTSFMELERAWKNRVAIGRDLED